MSTIIFSLSQGVDYQGNKQWRTCVDMAVQNRGSIPLASTILNERQFAESSGWRFFNVYLLGSAQDGVPNH